MRLSLAQRDRARRAGGPGRGGPWDRRGASTKGGHIHSLLKIVIHAGNRVTLWEEEEKDEEEEKNEYEILQRS